MRILFFALLFVFISCTDDMTSEFDHLLNVYTGKCFSRNSFLDYSNGQFITELDTTEIHEMEITNIDISELRNNHHEMTLYFPKSMQEEIYFISGNRIELDSIIGNIDISSMLISKSILLDRINNTLELKLSTTNGSLYGGFNKNCLYTVKE